MVVVSALHAERLERLGDLVEEFSERLGLLGVGVVAVAGDDEVLAADGLLDALTTNSSPPLQLNLFTNRSAQSTY